MAITISPLTKDEIPAFARLELEGFRSHPRIPMLWPAGYTDDLYAYYESNKRESFQDPKCRFMKAVDENGRLMAVSEWAFVLEPEMYAEGKKAVNPNGQPPSNWPLMGNWELRRFFQLNTEQWVNTSLAGRPYIMLEILVAHPEAQGRGAGTKLLTWGVEQADKYGIVMALESTPAGLTLYGRFGFREMDIIKADMKQFGYDQPYDEEAAKRVWMLREPESKT